MAKKRVIWSSHAHQELHKTLTYYNQRNQSTQYSLKLLGAIENLTDILSENELLGRLTTNNFTRVIPINRYLIFYEIYSDHIQIVSFWDNRQDPNKRIIQDL